MISPLLKKEKNHYFFTIIIFCFPDVKRENWISITVDQILSSNTCQAKDDCVRSITIGFFSLRGNHNDILLHSGINSYILQIPDARMS